MLENIEGISSLEFEDKDLFLDKINKQAQPTYSNSWLYVLRSSRNDKGLLDYKFHKNNLLFTVSRRKNTIYIGKPYDLKKEDIKDFILTIKSIQKSIGLPVILKKINLDFSKNIKRYKNFTFFNKNNLDLEDEKYEEKVLDLKLLLANGIHPWAKRFRLGVNRFQNKNINIREERLTMENFNFSAEVQYLKTLSRDNLDKFQAYINMLRDFEKNTFELNDNIIVIRYFREDSIHGYYIANTLGKKGYAGLYCGLTSAKWGGITEYLDKLYFQYLLDSGIQYLALGGAETKGVNYYVDKLLPSSPEVSEIPIILDL